MNGIEDYNIAMKLLLPEVFIIFAMIVACVWNLFFPKMKNATPIISFLGLAAGFTSLWMQLGVTRTVLFGGLYTVDPLTVGFGLIACAVGIVVVMMTTGYEYHFQNNAGEFYAILLTAVASVMLLAGSTDLIMLFIALETLSICCVILSGFEKKDIKSSEASLKYLLSTAATTATLLYGLSFIYGLTGSTSYDAIREQMAYISLPPTSLVKMFVMVLVLSVIGFKVSAAPFHMWTPDVYEGAPTPVTAFLSIGSKAGGFVVALRLLMTVFSSSTGDWAMILSLLAVFSMVAGNLIALAQTSFKRMLAYSSIAHIGYILIGFVANSESGLISVVFYLIVYGAMNLAAFAGSILFSNETGSDRIDDYAGLIRKRPALAVLLSIALFNLAGLPIPPAGFFAKFFIFSAGANMPLHIGHVSVGYLLVGIALITSIPAIYYYSRVAIKMIVREPSEAVAALPERRKALASPQDGPTVALAMCVVAIVLAGTTAVDPVVTFAHDSVRSILPGANPEKDKNSPISVLPGKIAQPQ